MNLVESRISTNILNSGMTYYEIAKKLGISQSVVRRWALTGKMSVNNIVPLCDLLNVDVRTLFYENEFHLRPVQQKAINLIMRTPIDKDEQIQMLMKMLK